MRVLFKRKETRPVRGAFRQQLEFGIAFGNVEWPLKYCQLVVRTRGGQQEEE